jgi:hypothetical protein
LIILILLEYPETISVEVRASAIEPLVVAGNAALSTEIHVFGVLIENPSPAKGVVLIVESVVVPQEVRKMRQDKMIILFMLRKEKK